MDFLEKAIIFAAKAHREQNRKGTDIPYITHPFAVGMLLQNAMCSEEVIASGILHDTLEDTATYYEDLEENFGAAVADLVLAASEHDKSLPWEERKQYTIDALKDASREEIQVIVADKLHNLRSIGKDYHADGEIIWKRFNRGKREQHWYYATIVKVLSSRKKESMLIGQLEEEVKGVFGTLDFLSEQEISLIFSCANLHMSDETSKKLESSQLLNFAQQLKKETDHLSRDHHDLLAAKLDDLQSRGIEFQSNSDGPFIISAFCLALQKKLQWTDQEVFKNVKKNIFIL